jgi:hypothetical protein
MIENVSFFQSSGQAQTKSPDLATLPPCGDWNVTAQREAFSSGKGGYLGLSFKTTASTGRFSVGSGLKPVK